MKKKLLTSFLVVIIAITCVVAFTACNDGNNTPQSEWPTDITDGYGFSNDYVHPTEVLKKPEYLTAITFMLDWSPNTNHTGLYVAKNLGYFNEENLNVAFIQPVLTGTSASVSAGFAQFGIDFQEQMIFNEKKGIDVTAVSAIIAHNTSGLLSKKSANITSPKDLVGKTYATWSLPGEQAIVKHVINKAGGDYTKVKMVPNTVQNIIGEFDNPNGVDCTWSYQAWDNILLENAGKDYNFTLMQDVDERLDYYTPVIIANNTIIETQPEVVQAFLRAATKGYQYAIAHPVEAADILIEENPELAPSRDAIVASQQFLASKYQDDSEYWGYIDAKRWDGFFDLMCELGKYDTVL